MTAETMMLVGGLCAFVLTLHWVRARELREKFAVYWLILAVLVLFVGIFPQSIMWFADAAHLSYPTAVLFLSLTVIYLFAFAVSVSLSTEHRRNVRLTQQMALLEERLRKLEAKGGGDGHG